MAEMEQAAGARRGMAAHAEPRVRSAERPAQLAVLAASATFFLVSLDTLIVNVALPTIAAELGGTLSDQQWVIDGYTLAFAALLLASGSLADRLGAKRLFVSGTALFALASLACALAPTMGALVAGRVLLGVAAAAVLPASMTIIREAYPDEARRARALGVWMAGGAVAAAAGPLLGGLLTPIHWSLIFSVNAPVCVLVLAACAQVAPSPQRSATFDAPGQLLATLGLTALVGGVIEAGERGISSPLVLGLLIGGALCLVAFVASQARVAHPMMPLALFGSKGMRVALFTGFAFILSWFGTVFLCSTYLQQGLGLSPMAAGLAFVPSAAGSFVGNIASGRIAARHGSGLPMAAGLGCEALGLLLLAALAPTLSATSVALLVAVVGLGGSLAMPATSSLVLASADARLSGVASALFNTFRQVGASIGIALFGLFVTAAPTLGGALRLSFAVAAALVVAAAVMAARLGGNPKR